MNGSDFALSVLYVISYIPIINNYYYEKPAFGSKHSYVTLLCHIKQLRSFTRLSSYYSVQ